MQGNVLDLCTVRMYTQGLTKLFSCKVQHQELKKVKKKDSFGGGRVGGLTHSKKR
jgi:hypothetical protein